MPFFSSKTIKHDLIGIASFFDFLCAVFSRIAYSEVPMPLFLVSGVFRIIPKELLVPLGQITDIKELNKDEQDLFKLNDPTNPLFKLQEPVKIRTYGGKKYIDFIPYAERINNLIEDTQNSPDYKQITDDNIKIESIATSNYGIVLIIGIKYIPNFIFTSFRGTYSTKTAQSYIQLSSFKPVKIAEGTRVVKGIAKIEFEMLHTILAANNDLATTFLGKNNIIPVFTGHSLGGAMAILLDYEYCSIIDNKGIQYFAPLSPTPVCVSFGSPRVLSKTTSETLCGKIVANKSLLHRYSNDGDPVTALPPPGAGFYHPCSSKSDKSKGLRKLVSRDCKSSTKMSKNLARSEYTKAINCRDVEPGMLTKSINVAPNMFDHATYLYISFAKAVDMVHLFGKSALTIETTEVGRVKNPNTESNLKIGDTEMFIYQMKGDNSVGLYTLDSIDLVKLRRKGDSILGEDSLMNNKMYSDILYVKEDKVDVTFNSNGLPISFQKKVSDQELEDIEDETYKKNLSKAVETSFGPIPQEIELSPLEKSEGGKRKCKRKSNKLTKKRPNKIKNRRKTRRK